ncbi:GNAT family N-acetyltransferase [Dyadobacter sp. CY107]|uniref:GNAT family N-acetyltransferase n=1 Tax=Dyadobacter fanqingshengii TaxID=2906443 RepID=UPI001F2EC3F8|nr:GNAT family N-acetyltransferase [Dyadobacter fanqingshengii]MCF2506134.1 GNAT family N-acetyltransferase [Dyadobacter fanqingshengii]
MPSFSIKHATVADIPEIIAIQEKTWEPTYGDILTKEQIDFMFEKIYSHESLLRQFTVEQHYFLILLNDNKPEGFASVSGEGPEKFKLHKIYVLPSKQGTGAGKYLLAETEKYVKSVGGKTLVLNVNRYNKARGFYEKMGFAVTGEEDIPIGPFWMNDYILEKQLN